MPCRQLLFLFTALLLLAAKPVMMLAEALDEVIIEIAETAEQDQQDTEEVEDVDDFDKISSLERGIETSSAFSLFYSCLYLNKAPDKISTPPPEQMA